MRSKYSSPKKPAEQVVKDIRRATDPTLESGTSVSATIRALSASASYDAPWD